LQREIGQPIGTWIGRLRVVEATTEAGDRGSVTQGIRGIRIALFGYIGLFILQVSAYLLTNVLVLLAGALDTLSDVLISGFLLLALHFASRPTDPTHMFGQARAQNVAAFAVAVVFIVFVSFEMFRQAIPRLLQPEMVGMQNIPIGIGVTIIAIAITVIPLIDIVRFGYREPAIQAQLVALIEMLIAYIASLIALLLVDRGYSIADPIATMIVAAFIALSGVYLIRENVPYLIGKSPPDEVIWKIRELALSVEGVRAIHDLVAEYVGPNILYIGLHIEVPKGTLIEIADQIAEVAKERIEHEIGCRLCVIYVDPWCPHDVCVVGPAPIQDEG
jgi:cation diffusion facilitator family transporter